MDAFPQQYEASSPMVKSEGQRIQSHFSNWIPLWDSAQVAQAQLQTGVVNSHAAFLQDSNIDSATSNNSLPDSQPGYAQPVASFDYDFNQFTHTPQLLHGTAQMEPYLHYNSDAYELPQHDVFGAQNLVQQRQHSDLDNARRLYEQATKGLRDTERLLKAAQAAAGLPQIGVDNNSAVVSESSEFAEHKKHWVQRLVIAMQNLEDVVDAPKRSGKPAEGVELTKKNFWPESWMTAKANKLYDKAYQRQEGNFNVPEHFVRKPANGEDHDTLEDRLSEMVFALEVSKATCKSVLDVDFDARFADSPQTELGTKAHNAWLNARRNAHNEAGRAIEKGSVAIEDIKQLAQSKASTGDSLAIASNSGANMALDTQATASTTIIALPAEHTQQQSASDFKTRIEARRSGKSPRPAPRTKPTQRSKKRSAASQLQSSGDSSFDDSNVVANSNADNDNANDCRGKRRRLASPSQ